MSAALGSPHAMVLQFEAQCMSRLPGAPTLRPLRSSSLWMAMDDTHLLTPPSLQQSGLALSNLEQTGRKRQS